MALGPPLRQAVPIRSPHIPPTATQRENRTASPFEFQTPATERIPFLSVTFSLTY